MEKKPPFVPFEPVTLNANIILDPELSATDCRIIAIAYCLRSEIQKAASPEKMEELLKQITVSKFAVPLNKTRDHTRKIINKLLKENHPSKKYLKLFALRTENNKEWLIRLNFCDNLVDALHLTNTQHENSLHEEFEILPWQQRVLIQHYIEQIKKLRPEFSDTPMGLLNLVGTTGEKLVDGLFYLLQRIKVKKIENVKGYLKSCFDESGNFKYKVQPIKYFPQDQKTTIKDDFEYQIPKKIFLFFKTNFEKTNGTKTKFYYREDEVAVYLQSIKKAGKDLNVQGFLRRNDLPFQIIKDYTLPEVQQ